MYEHNKNKKITSEQRLPESNPVVQLKQLLRETYVNKLDLTDLLERVDYLPPQFATFVHKYWEKGNGRELVVKYLATIRTDKFLQQAQKENAYRAIIRLLRTLQAQHQRLRAAQESRDLRQSRELTAELITTRLKKLSPEAQAVKVFLDSLPPPSQESSVLSRRTQEWLRSRDVGVSRLAEWYPRVRNLLLLRGNKSGVAWLDRQLLAYLQKNGEGLGIV